MTYRDPEVASLLKENAALRKENADFRKENRSLRKQLGKSRKKTEESPWGRHLRRKKIISRVAWGILWAFVMTLVLMTMYYRMFVEPWQLN